MDVDESLKKINKDRCKTEAAFVFSIWRDPDLFEDYIQLNEGKDKTLTDKDSQFYFALGKAMYKKGYRTFDAMSLETFLKDKPDARKRFESYGGWHECKQLMSICNPDNTEAYFDDICRMNSLSNIAKKYNEMFEHVERFENATNEDIFNAFDALNSSVSIASQEKIEQLSVDDNFIKALEDGEDMGFSYGKYSPLLNYITLGATPGVYMIAGHSGVGKSSFAFGNIIMSLHYSGIKSAIISNEMDIKTYKVLLLEHILTQELNYWGLTRKQIRMGKWNDEQREMINKAKQISKEKYSDISFVRMFGYNIGKLTKYLRKLKAQGVSVVLFDTFKASDDTELGLVWQSLLMDSRKLDNECRRLGICCLTTFQLALHTLNQRYLDATCLSNAKQVKEVYETQVYLRKIWDDEFSGEKYDIHPWKYNRDNKKIKEEVTLDRNKTWLLLFIDKTRADEDKTVLVYEWLPHFNVWHEHCFARVVNNHTGF